MSPDQQVKVTISGKSYLVEIGDLSVLPTTVKVNGQPYMVNIETAEVEKISTGGPTAAAGIVARQPKSPPTNGSDGSGVKDVKAPMPGNIVNITVSPGDQVRVGQSLCSLEAMKMQNAIRSPHDGIIAGVAVISGQAVAHGDVLFTFE